MKTRAIGVLLSGLVTAGPAFAGPAPEALSGWRGYVKATEARRAAEERLPGRFLAIDSLAERAEVLRALEGGSPFVSAWRTPQVDRALSGAQVHHWLGAVFVPDVTLDDLLPRLRGTSIHRRQGDVLAARILRSSGDEQQLYLRLRRSQIVTVTYDTEHLVHFAREDAQRASSTSVATRIVEIDHPGEPGERIRPDDEDRGFLWRLNAYWRYRAVPGGVIVECESLSLSRQTPFGLGPLVGPFVTRIARESMERTLRAIRESFQGS